MSNDSVVRNARALALLRIAIGMLFVLFGEYKIADRAFIYGGGFEHWIHRFLDGGTAYPFMVPILHDVVLHAARPLAVLVAVGECAIGVSLILGVLTRWASACGLVFMLALLFSSSYPGAGSALWMYCGAALDHLVFALCFMAFIVGEPQATWAMRGVRTRSSRGRHGL